MCVLGGAPPGPLRISETLQKKHTFLFTVFLCKNLCLSSNTMVFFELISVIVGNFREKLMPPVWKLAQKVRSEPKM